MFAIFFRYISRKGNAFAITDWIIYPGNIILKIHKFLLLDKYLELYIALKKTYICSEKKYVFVKNIYLSRREKCIFFQLLLIAIFPIFEGTGWCVQPKVQLVKERCTSWKIKKTDALFERRKKLAIKTVVAPSRLIGRRKMFFFKKKNIDLHRELDSTAVLHLSVANQFLILCKCKIYLWRLQFNDHRSAISWRVTKNLQYVFPKKGDVGKGRLVSFGISGSNIPPIKGHQWKVFGG